MKVFSSSIWAWLCTAAIAVAMLSSSLYKKEVGKQLEAFPTVKFELKNGVTGYSKFLTRLRNQLEAPTRACTLRSTRNQPLPGSEYVLVDLKISNKQWVTLGIDAKDSYVWAYQDNVKYDGNYRATFLNDTPQAAKDQLFLESTRRITRFGGNYNSLERAARTTRENLELGIQNLDGVIRKVYGKQESELNKGTDEARFFLIAIQMVPESARFKFMERAIVSGDYSDPFKRKMVAFQNDWDPISQAIHKAEGATPKCVTITPTLIIGKIDYRQEVNRVDEIKNDMGLLKCKDEDGSDYGQDYLPIL